MSTTNEPGRQHHDTAQQPEHSVDGNAHEPQRKEQNPHEWIDDQRQQGQRPTKHEQDAPEQELHHTWNYVSSVAEVRSRDGQRYGKA